MKNKLFLFLICLVQFIYAGDNKMQWWKDAKFGMFIHWGIYSVPAGKWEDRIDHGEWLMLNAQIPCDTYAKFAEEFNPTKFNAEEWVKLAKAAGQKYIVITSKHHDGFAMFKSDASKYNIVDATPFKRDVIAELAEACRKHDMKFGLYYSQAQDWYHPGGAKSMDKQWDIKQKGDMMEYIKTVALPQVKEILSKYGDIAVLWWDTPKNMTSEMSKLFEEVVKQYPNLITNNRLGGGTKGDLETPEQFIPATGFKNRNWEVCMTMNGKWGYNAYDENWKTTEELLHKLIDIVSKGGNFLLNVGPTAQGIIPMVCQNTLREIGKWLNVNGEAIYGTTASPFPYLEWGRATRKGDKLYLHVFDWPENGILQVPLYNKIKSASLMINPELKLKYKSNKDGLSIKLPAYAPDKIASVIVLELNGEPKVNEIPSNGISVDYKGNSIKILTDGTVSSVWRADSGEKTVELEMDFGKLCTIRAFSLVECWHPWDNVIQTYDLQYFKDGMWKTVKSGETSGTGETASFNPVKTTKVKMIISNNKYEPALKEWILFE